MKVQLSLDTTLKTNVLSDIKVGHLTYRKIFNESSANAILLRLRNPTEKEAKDINYPTLFVIYSNRSWIDTGEVYHENYYASKNKVWIDLGPMDVSAMVDQIFGDESQ